MNLSEMNRELATLAEQHRGNPDIMSVFLEFFRQRRDEMDEEARREADRRLDIGNEILVASARQRITTMTDGAERRILARAIARADGSHLTAFDLVEVLKGETQQKSTVVGASVAPFVTALQTCADFLHDDRAGSFLGRPNATVLQGRLIALIDELLAAFHLAQRAFANQAYAHLRTVEDVFDAIEVLARDAALMDEWLAATEVDAERAVFRKIRQRVGTVTTDAGRALYAFLSALGTHSQFRGLQARAEVNRPGTEVTFYVAGSATHVEAANVLTVRAAVATAHQISRLLAPTLHQADVEAQLRLCDAGLDGLLRTYLGHVAEQMELEPADAVRVLDYRIGRSAVAAQ